MLDFYIIPDTQNSPASPEQVGLEYAGGLEMAVFFDLREKGFIEAKFDYYSDFRWSGAFVQQKYDFIMNLHQQKDSNLNQLLVLLERALKKGCDLIAYGD